MSRYFPHTAYAEDQPLSHTILGVHVLTRGYTTGAIVGLGAVSAGSLYSRLRGATKPVPTIASSPAVAAAASATMQKGLPRLLRKTGTASAVGLGLMGLALAGRMQGREDIEWRDRAWRLLENPGQLETDDSTYGGAAAGVVALGAWRLAGAKGVGGLRAAAGAAGLGSVAGTVGYMVWRYGMHAGKFPEYVPAEKVEFGRV
ncbi:hypothetical protein CGCS363_v005339 [Colletotrichum siamense]|uniref:uncharacterized protein n=1 Tax=Colletotrichum siamense TaxID=690259 RepID=UPI00187252F7|nr:uncharacterized protein CGCS363_v005339 [Colletotrichum siamense]KAF5505841.1 hypothetical protein CGCS363_v005339 [Colletotrichum siamense]